MDVVHPSHSDDHSPFSRLSTVGMKERQLGGRCPRSTGRSRTIIRMTLYGVSEENACRIDENVELGLGFAKVLDQLGDFVLGRHVSG